MGNGGLYYFWQKSGWCRFGLCLSRHHQLKKMMKLLDPLDDCTHFHKDMVGKPTSTGKKHGEHFTKMNRHFLVGGFEYFLIFTPILGDS